MREKYLIIAILGYAICMAALGREWYLHPTTAELRDNQTIPLIVATTLLFVALLTFWRRFFLI